MCVCVCCFVLCVCVSVYMCVCVCAAQLVAVINERARGVPSEDPQACLEPPDHGVLLWRVAGVMVRHGGHLHSAPGAGHKGQVGGGGGGRVGRWGGGGGE